MPAYNAINSSPRSDITEALLSDPFSLIESPDGHLAIVNGVVIGTIIRPTENDPMSEMWKSVNIVVGKLPNPIQMKPKPLPVITNKPRLIRFED